MSEPVKEPVKGTFVAMYPRWTCAHDLYLWARRHAIPNLVEPAEMHVTTVYSNDVVPGWKPLGNSMLPIKIHPRQMRWARFGPMQEVLVLRIFHQAIERRHYQLKAQGFRTVYNPAFSAAYAAHMTISYDYTGDLAELPRITDFGQWLTLNRECSNPLRSNEVGDDPDDWAFLRR